MDTNVGKLYGEICSLWCQGQPFSEVVILLEIFQKCDPIGDKDLTF